MKYGTAASFFFSRSKGKILEFELDYSLFWGRGGGRTIKGKNAESWLLKKRTLCCEISNFSAKGSCFSQKRAFCCEKEEGELFRFSSFRNWKKSFFLV